MPGYSPEELEAKQHKSLSKNALDRLKKKEAQTNSLLRFASSLKEKLGKDGYENFMRQKEPEKKKKNYIEYYPIGYIDDRVHVECPDFPHKIAFRSIGAANRAIHSSYKCNGKKRRPYFCRGCGCYHLSTINKR